MKFKVDENLPVETADILQKAGHEADTVYTEGIAGADDAAITKICREENRALITLDLGFSDIRSYPPSEFEGIIVLRVTRQDKLHVLTIIQRLTNALTSEGLRGKLWIVDEKRIRVRQ
jgi:predicted nuclease of predicted toxin-antitoxin system